MSRFVRGWMVILAPLGCQSARPEVAAFWCVCTRASKGAMEACSFGMEGGTRSKVRRGPWLQWIYRHAACDQSNLIVANSHGDMDGVDHMDSRL